MNLQNVLSSWNDYRYDTREIAMYRKSLLQNVTGQILEIGVGTGLNMPYYPSEVRQLTGIDERVIEIDDNRIQLDYYYGTSNALPFETNSFDTLVVTFALSRRIDVSTTLEEIKRVLRPRGRLLLLEHGRAEDKKQGVLLDLIAPIYETIGHRVYNREYFEILKEYDFLIANGKKYSIHMPPKLLKGTLYYGVAINIK